MPTSVDIEQYPKKKREQVARFKIESQIKYLNDKTFCKDISWNKDHYPESRTYDYFKLLDEKLSKVNKVDQIKQNLLLVLQGSMKGKVTHKHLLDCAHNIQAKKP